MPTGINELLTVTFTLFAVIDIVGSIPLLLSLKKNMGGIQEVKATWFRGNWYFVLVSGRAFPACLKSGDHSFAVVGLFVIFVLGLEMIPALNFRLIKNPSQPWWSIAFPLIAGSGTLTTIISLKANYNQSMLLFAILINLVIIYVVLKSLNLIERILGPAGMLAIRKFFVVILLAIAIKIFISNVPGLIK